MNKNKYIKNHLTEISKQDIFIHKMLLIFLLWSFARKYLRTDVIFWF